jgi:asparagine synthase (glutamine-hydrolysing)
MDRAIIKASAELGVNTILTGIGAEIITQGNRYYLGDLLRQGKYKTLLDAAKAWAKAKNTNLWAIVYPFALYPLTPSFLKQGIPTLLRRGYAQDINVSPYSIPPWIKADFAKTYHLWEKSLDLMTPSGNTSLESSYQILGLKAFMGNWNNWYLANDVNIHLSHPFLDPRLISFCLSLPTALRENPYLPKPVLQEAMKGILPEPVRTRRYKANFNEVYGKGLNRHLPQLRQLILESGVEQLGIFDKQILIDKIEQQAIGLGNVVSGSRINNSLALIAWYKLTFGQKT